VGKNHLKAFRPIIILGALLALSTQGFAQNEIQCTIDGKIEGLGRKTVFLAGYFGNKLYYSDTAVSDSRGRVIFNKSSGYKAGVYAIVTPGPKYFEFIINEAEIKFITEASDLSGQLRIIESKENRIFLDYLNYLRDSNVRRNKLHDQINTAPNTNLSDRLDSIDSALTDYKRTLIKSNPNSLVAVLVKMSMPVDVPDDERGTTPLEANTYFQYRNHYWDNVDLSDERILRIPTFANKFDKYLNIIIPQIPDTIITLIDRMIGRIKSKEVFKYVVNAATYKYETSDRTDMDVVFSHMVLEYYCPKGGRESRATWMEPQQLGKMCERANEIALKEATSTSASTDDRVEATRDIVLNISKDAPAVDRIAVVGIGGMTCTGAKANDAALADMAAVSLSKRYSILERQNLNSILDEAKFGMTGLVDEASAARVGGLIGAQAVLMCKQTCFEGKDLFTVKLVQCDTGKQVWAASGINVSYTELLKEITKAL